MHELGRWDVWRNNGWIKNATPRLENQVVFGQELLFAAGRVGKKTNPADLELEQKSKKRAAESYGRASTVY